MAIQALGGAVLVGHSFGGLVALHAAAAEPALVEALVLLEPAVGLDSERAAMLRDELRQLERWPNLAAARSGYAELVAPEGRAEALAWFDANRIEADDGSVTLPCSWEAVASACEAMAEPLPALERVTTPTTVALAEHASIVSEETRRELASRLPVVELTSISGGHDLVWEAPAVVGEVLRRSLAR